MIIIAPPVAAWYATMNGLFQVKGEPMVEDDEWRRDDVRRSMTAQYKDRTLCEVLREIWRLADKMYDGELCDEIQEKLIDATIMAMKMDRKLQEYQAKGG